MEVNVAYACNDAYIVHTGISLISLFENNKDIDKLTVFFIDMGTTQESKDELQAIVDKYNRKLIIIPFTEWESDLPVSSTGRHIKSVYAKIFFGRIRDIDKILYLDSDTVVVNSIKKLWNTDIEEYAIAGVQTISTVVAKSKIGLDKESFVINDGIVLMNLKQWRKLEFEKKCIDFIKKWNGNPPVLSEGTINAVCQNKMYKLGIRNNLTSASIDYTAKEIETITQAKYYSQEEINKAITDPCIIHYVSGFHERPWCQNSSHPFKKEYLKYKRLSKWIDTSLEKGELSARIKLIAAVHRILPRSLFYTLYKFGGKDNRV